MSMSNEVLNLSSDEEANPSSGQLSRSKMVYEQKRGKEIEVETSNLDCLDPEKYLKDDIIQVYCSYLLNEVCSAIISPKVHIFDNLFYQQLDKIFTEENIDVDKLKQLSSWYSGVDIFDKHFLIFPICDSEHWFAIVVCYPAAVKAIDKDDASQVAAPTPRKDAPVRRERIPGIMVMDSLRLKRINITMKVRDFLDHGWRSKLREVKRFAHTDLADYFPELPKQQNAYDCGVYLLMYIRCFLSQPDYFYRLVRQGDHESNQILRDKIVECLKENGREAIRELIKKICK